MNAPSQNSVCTHAGKYVNLFQYQIINLHCSTTIWKDYLQLRTLGSHYQIIPINEKMAHIEKFAHLFGYSGNEGGWSGRGNEGEGMPRRAGGVSCWAQRQAHCDAKQGSGKKRKREKKHQKYRLKRLDTAYNVSSRSMGALKQLEYNGLATMSSDQESGCSGIKYKIE